MDAVNEIKNLPYELIFIMTFGYLGYFLSSHKRASDEKRYEVIFKTLMFGLPTFILLQNSGWVLEGDDLYRVIISAFSLTMLAVGVNAFAVSAYNCLPRELRFGPRTAHAQTWDDFKAEKDQKISYVKIHLINDETLISNIYQIPDKRAVNKLVVDMDGNVALYITQIRKGDKVTDLPIPPEDDAYGLGMTYVPKEQIRRITFHKI